MKLLDFVKSLLQTNNGLSIEECIFRAKECMAHLVEIAAPEVLEVAEVFLHAAIRNGYLANMADMGAKELAEWAVTQAIKYQKDLIDPATGKPADPANL